MPMANIESAPSDRSVFRRIRAAGISDGAQRISGLSVGFVAKVDQVMKVASLSETVKVSGGSPVVEWSTAVRTELKQEAIALLPTSRDGLKVYLNQVPGIRTNLSEGPAGGGDAIRFRANGQNGEAWDLVEGVMAGRSNSSANSGTHLDFGAVDEVSVQTVGSNAEMPRRGIMVKSSPSRVATPFTAGPDCANENGRLQSNNLDDELRAQGIRAVGRIVGNRESNGDLGGRIVRDKLWFFLSGSRKDFEQETLDAYYPDGSPILTEFSNAKTAQKLSYQLTPGNRFILFNIVPPILNCEAPAASFRQNRGPRLTGGSTRPRASGRRCGGRRW